MTTEPYPTAEAIRLTELARTSPTAYIPERLVAYGVLSKQPDVPVRTSPFLSSFTVPKSQPEFGSAPIITKTPPIGFRVVSPVLRLVQATNSKVEAPSSFSISVSVWSVMWGDRSIREIRYCDIVLSSDGARMM